MIRTLAAAIGIVACSASAGYAAVGDWESYTQLDIRRLAATNSAVWAATGGGIIRSNIEDGTVRIFSASEGLSDADMRSVALDGNGTVWFGSQNGGLIRFVPSGGSTQPVLKEPALLEGEVSGVEALFVNGDTLYIGHSSGVTVMKLSSEQVIETYHQLGPSSAIRNHQVVAVGIADSRIVVGLKDGYSVAERGDNLLLPGSWNHIESTVFANATAIREFDGSLFIAGPRGLRRETSSGWMQVISSPVSDLVEFEGYLFAATDDGLLRSSDGDTWVQSSALTAAVNALAAVEGGYLVGAAEDGTYRIESADATSATKVAGVDFPPFSLFHQMAVDTSGALWVAPGPLIGGSGDFAQLGFMRYKDDVWTQFPSGQNGVPTPNAKAGYRSIAVDGDNRVWVGSHGLGMLMLDQSTEPPTVTRVNYNTTAMIGLETDDDYIVGSAMTPNPDGGMLMAVFHSLGWAAPPGFTLPASDVTQIGNQYIGTEVGPINEPTAIAVDHDGVVWIGTEAGLLLFDMGGTPYDSTDDQYAGTIGVEGITSAVGLKDANVQCLAVDREGVIWVGTADGLTALKGSYDRGQNLYSLTSRHYTESDGLPSSIINAIAVDSVNVKWIGTQKGLAEVTAGGQVVSLASNVLVDPDGRVLSLAYDHSNGLVWIGTSQGANTYQAYAVRTGDGVTAEPLENPYKIDLSRRGTDYVLDGDPLVFLVTPGADFRIYTLTGELVWQEEDSGIGQVSWDGRTRSGERVVGSGIYLYVAQYEGQSKVGKIAVLRNAQ